MRCKGIPASKGIAIGRVMHYVPWHPEPVLGGIEHSEVRAEIIRYDQGRNAAEKELDDLLSQSLDTSSDRREIVDAHKTLLLDEAIDSEIRSLISGDLFTCDQAIDQVYNQYIQEFSQMDDALLKERAADLTDLKHRLLRCRQGLPPGRSLQDLPEPVIVVARDMLPSDTATINPDVVIGIVTEQGGATCHTAIIARSLGIPAVLGVPDALCHLADGEEAIVDAVEGVVYLSPSINERIAFEQKQKELAQKVADALQYLHREPVTLDGVPIEVALNIEAPSERELTAAAYTDGVGLFRTEFLYMDRSYPPDEEEQVELYTRVLRAYGSKPVVIRTMDIGGDKQVDCISLPRETNPFLGKRALRLCFDEIKIFKTQLRACMRASVHGNLWVMFPMVGSVDDIRRVKAIINTVGRELDEQGIRYCQNIKWGIMVEIPAVAVIADLIVHEVDFVSIGTNDLTQYTLAADRMNPDVAEYYQSLHPAVLRMIRHLSEVFQANGKHLSICGELAGTPLAIPALIGMGVRCLSMGRESVGMAKKIICNLRLNDAKSLAEEVNKLPTAGEIEQALQVFNESYL